MTQQIETDTETESPKPFRPHALIAALIAVTLITLTLLLILWPFRDGETVSAQVVETPAEPTYEVHTVRRGDRLYDIADAHGVSREALLLLNRAELMARADARCSKLSERYRNRKVRGDQGYYCNESLELKGQPIVWANSIQAGDKIRIPFQTVPEAVQTTIATMPEKANVVLVVDETGSMSNDREVVSQWYLGAIRNSNRNIDKIVLYNEGVRVLEGVSDLRLQTSGGRENVLGALRVANSFSPDAIILVTDEPGDDWGWSLSSDLSGMPPVYTHSLDPMADSQLQAVASATGGKFTPGSPRGIASR